MTRPEAIHYAIDWLRAFPALPTAAPHVQAERHEAVRLLSEPCVWREDEDGIHHTGCGEMFCFDGPLVDHKQRFCGYCGAAIREVRF